MDEKFDIDVKALWQGGLAGCGSGCVAVPIILLLIVIAGLNSYQMKSGDVPGWVLSIVFLLGTGSNVLVGYVTARAASRSPNLHALIMAIIVMLLTLFSKIGSSQSSSVPNSPKLVLFELLSWILVIPATLWGAKLAVEQKNRAG